MTAPGCLPELAAFTILFLSASALESLRTGPMELLSMGPIYLLKASQTPVTVIRNLPENGQAIASVRFLLHREKFHSAEAEPLLPTPQASNPV